MTASATTATTAHPPATGRLDPRPGRSQPRRAASSDPRRRPSDLPREYRIAHVYRTLGRGLIAEYDPD